MKLLAVLADVHANLPALQAVLQDLRAFDVDQILVAGDLTAGPKPDETIRLLREAGSRVILGNSDINLLRFAGGKAPQSWLNSRQFALLRWGSQNSSAETLEYLRSLPEQLVITPGDAAPIRMVHGSPRDPYESILPEENPAQLEAYLGQIQEQVLICGHTHQAWARQVNGKLGLNPGSVAAPLSGENGAQYALLHWQEGGWQPELRCVPYDLRGVRADFESSCLLEEGGPLARAFLLSIESGKDVSWHFLTFAYRLADQSGYPGCKVIPDEIWEQAGQQFDWSLESIAGLPPDPDALLSRPLQ